MGREDFFFLPHPSLGLCIFLLPLFSHSPCIHRPFLEKVCSAGLAFKHGRQRHIDFCAKICLLTSVPRFYLSRKSISRRGFMEQCCVCWRPLRNLDFVKRPALFHVFSLHSFHGENFVAGLEPAGLRTYQTTCLRLRAQSLHRPSPRPNRAPRMLVSPTPTTKPRVIWAVN